MANDESHARKLKARCRMLLQQTCLVLALGSAVRTAVANDPVLQGRLDHLLQRHRGQVALAIRNLETQESYEYNARQVLPTASLIKLPLMVSAYRLVDQGKLDLSATKPLEADEQVPGSGILTAHLSAGIKLPLRDYVRLMMRYSDNTATNIIAKEIGLAATAETMEALGFPQTKLHSLVYRRDSSIFPQRSQQYGLGSTTAQEMVELLSKLHAGELASVASTKAMREHLLACEDNTKLAAQLPEDVKFAHKTGAVSNCRTDAGIMYCANGAVAVCFLSNQNEDQSWSETSAANVLAGKIGAVIVERFGASSSTRPLRMGSHGKLVESLQRTLNARLDPSPRLAIDGDFGPATRAAVERFQAEHELASNGALNESTWRALGKLVDRDEPVPDPALVNQEVLRREPRSGLSAAPIVTCQAWTIADGISGEILFSHAGEMAREAASTTKIMTAYVVLQYAKQHPERLAETVRFSARADNTIGSTSGLRAGERATVKELLYGLLLPSGNDAAVALAEHVGARLKARAAAGDDQDPYDHFVSAMNETAKELGLSNAQYRNPHGLPDREHVISANDLARLTMAAMRTALFRELVGTRQFGCVVRSEQGYERNVIWKNTNQLLKIEGFQGVKTGTTSAAGACLVAWGERDGDVLLAVVLGASSSAARYADTRNLLRWAWQQRVEDDRK